MNAILEKIIDSRNGHYCHALEVNDVCELKSAVESLHDEFSKDYSLEEIKDFFNTMEIYCLDDNNEDEVFGFNTSDYLDTL